MMQRIESTTVWRCEKMQSDCATGENKKPGGVPRRRLLLQIALLNIEDGSADDFLIKKNPSGNATGTE